MNHVSNGGVDPPGEGAVFESCSLHPVEKHLEALQQCTQKRLN